MKSIKNLFETIKHIIRNWGVEEVDNWDEEYLQMTL